VVLFVVGIIVILDAVFTTGTHVAELVVGLILVGTVSVGDVVADVAKRLKQAKTDA
jgi:hypothetical protein